jgi:hypothetical protein
MIWTFLFALQSAVVVAPQPAPIWNDLTVGMSRADVKAKYPFGRTLLGDGCLAAIEGIYERDGLAGVKLSWSSEDRNPRCGEIVGKGMLARYGAPDQVNGASESRSCRYYGRSAIASLSRSVCLANGGGKPVNYSISKWSRGGIDITFERIERNDSFWSAVYKPALSASSEVVSKL